MSKIYLSEEPHFVIQGEGAHVGTKMLLLRLAWCNVRCKSCFGIVGGRRNPRITTLDKPNTKLSDIKIGDNLLTYNDNKEMVTTTVTDLIRRKVDEWYEVKINRTLYYVTQEHPFFTTEGLVKMEDLKIGDTILHSTREDKNSYRMLRNNPMFNPTTAKLSAENTDYEKVAEKVKKTIYKKKEEGRYISSWDSLSEEGKEALSAKLSEGKLKEKNPNWRGGPKHPNYTILAQTNKDKELPCEVCGELKKLEVHHIDEDHNNDSFENMISVCHKCHSIIHERGFNFWAGDRVDSKVAHTEGIIARNGYEVESIKKITNRRKPLEVYNLSCEPYNSYLIDNMWVHNCDSPQTWEKLKKIEYTLEEVEKIITDSLDSGVHNILITGGEPALQQDKILELMRIINPTNSVTWHIETAGHISWNSLRHHNTRIQYNFSPKIGSLTPEFDWEWIALEEPHPLNYIVKVVTSPENWDIDYDAIIELQMKYNIPDEKIYLMPLGIHREEIIKNSKFCIDKAFEKNYNFSSRQHILLFDDKKLV